MPSPLLRGCLALGLLLVASCGDDGPAPPPPGAAFQVQDLVLRAETPRELPEVHMAQKLLPPADFDSAQPMAGKWQPDARLAGVQTLQDIPGANAALAMKLGGKDEAKELHIVGPFDPATFNEVVVELYTPGEQSVLVWAIRKGKGVVGAEALTVRGEKKVQAVPFRLAKLHGEEEPIDAIAIRFKESPDLAAVLSVGLVWNPYSSFLPSPEAPDLIDCTGRERELRRGFGLSSESPLVTPEPFTVQEQGELCFSYTYPAELRVRRAAPKLEVEILSEGEVLRTESLALETKGAPANWYHERIDLAEFAGRDVTARFSVTNRREDREVVCGLGEVRQRVRGAAPPTVLLISSDTHRADHIGSARPDPLVYTPVLDSLGMRGVVFSNGFTATNVTNPSHIALLTGVHPRDTRILNNSTPLVDEAVTVAERFREAGYRTFASVSARHLVHMESGLGQGFDRMSAPKRPERPAPETIAHLLEWLDDASGEPVFLFLHCFDVHAPYEPQGEYDRKYYDKDRNPYDPAEELGILLRDGSREGVEVPPFLAGLTDRDFPYQQYRAEVDYLDNELDDLLGLGRVREGIVAFTSDHGESFGEHGIWWDHVGLYPTSIHVPLMIRWPGGPASLRVDEPVRQIDIGRTLLDLAGIERAEFPGRSLLWAIERPEEAEPRFALAAHGFGASVTIGPWHLILNLRDENTWPLEKMRPGHEVELYHLERDPGCLDNLVDEEFERAKQLRERLIEWLDAADPVGLGSRGGFQSASAQASLQALGYLSEDEEADPGQAWYQPDPENEWVKRFEKDE